MKSAQRKQKIRVKIEGGVFHVLKKPKSIVVDVIDRDVDGLAETEPAACHCKQGGGTLHAHWQE